MRKIILNPDLTTKIKGLKVDLYVTPKCNFKCPYCASQYDKINDFGQTNLKNIKYFIDCIAKSKYDIILCILGGEPTLFKDLNGIVKYALTKPNIKEIELYTNGSTNLKRIDIKPLRIILSVHPYMFEKFKPRILKNIKYIKDSKDYVVKIMAESGNLKEIISDIQSLTPKYFIHYINNINDSFFTPNYSNKIQEKIINVGDEKITFLKYIQDYFRSPKGYYYMCSVDNISVYQDGSVIKYCGKEYTDNLFSNPDAIKNFKITLEKCKQDKTLGCQELEIPKFLCKY